jgi:hypothetical protein
LTWCGIVFAQVPAKSNGAPLIHLKGRARIDAHAGRYSGEIALSGTVADDTGAPAPLRVDVTLSSGGSGGSGRSPLVPLANAAPEACAPGGSARVLSRALIVVESATHLVIPSDASGQFCVRLLLPTDRYVAHLAVEPSALLDGATTEVPFDVGTKPVRLQITAPSAPATVAIDERSAPLAIDATAASDVDGTQTPASGLALHFTNEAGTSIGDATTDSVGRARVVTAPAVLGPAGRGEIRVAFAGDGATSAASATMAVERRTHVDLDLPDVPGAVLAPAWPEDGIALTVRAVATCRSRGCTGVPTGIIEASVHGVRVGAAPLAGAAGVSVAHLVATFTPPPEMREASVDLRYVPDAPWFLASAPQVVLQPVRAPLPWGRVLSAVAGIAVLAWFVASRARTTFGLRAHSDSPKRDDGPASRGGAGLIVREAKEANGPVGWIGRVVDAHDRTPVQGASVTLERRGFDRATVILSATSNAEGTFALSPPALAPGDELVVRSRFHTTFRAPVTPTSPARALLEVAVTSRKRALLDGFATWARRRGAPFDQKPDATPGHVRLTAVAQPEIARWAEAVEYAAFGYAPVDADAQSEVERLAPTDARRAPQEDEAIDADHVDGARPGSV